VTTVVVDTLAAAAARVDPDAHVVGPGGTVITSVCLDSRQAGPGSLFACVRGAVTDGHRHAAEAVARGAAAIMVDHVLDDAGLTVAGSGPVPQLVVSDVRRCVGPVAATQFDNPSQALDVVGVTGTNGKTTTVSLVADVMAVAGRPCTVIGTLTGVRTTPEAPELQRRLAAARDHGSSVVAMEVSSHALDQHRVDGTRFAVAVFTNLSRDHLDYHGDMDSYFTAKARLFTPELCDHAVITVDDDAGRRLAASVSVPVTTCSVADVSDVEMGPAGTGFTWRGQRVGLRLAGRFNVANAVAAATAATVLGVDPEVIAAGLATTEAVPGRFERVEAGQPFTVVVDFAHTPDALAQVLAAATEMAAGATAIVVFGCGGERDASKRALMGKVAAESGADVVVTADNSRSESTDDIVAAIVEGVASVPGGSDACTVQTDRRLAMALALDRARPGDVVVVAGRGHEQHLTIGDTPVPFDDRAVATELLAERGWVA
jgi:UDP-N-acetylmuramoyl-L-alanyl-D-glutamate--2,6-diaminopimelate ligase